MKAEEVAQSIAVIVIISGLIFAVTKIDKANKTIETLQKRVKELEEQLKNLRDHGSNRFEIMDLE